MTQRSALSLKEIAREWNVIAGDSKKKVWPHGRRSDFGGFLRLAQPVFLHLISTWSQGGTQVVGESV